MLTSRPTQADVAKMAGVSRQLVSLVVRDDPRVSPERRRRVHEAMEKLGYRPNAAARSLATQRTGIVGIVVPGFANPYYGELTEAMRDAGERAGWDPLIASVGEDPAREVQAIERFLELNVDALVLVSPLTDSETLDRYGEMVPTVVVTRNQAPASVDLLHYDDRAVGRMATQHLLDRGYSPVVFIGFERPVVGDSSGERRQGYVETVEAAGQEPISVILTDPADEGEIVDSLVVDLGTGFGIVCHNDQLAIMVAATCKRAGLFPGRDVGITGVDNTIWAALPGIELTSTDQDLDRMARTTYKLIAERLEGRTRTKEIVQPPRLVTRASSDPAM